MMYNSMTDYVFDKLTKIINLHLKKHSNFKDERNRCRDVYHLCHVRPFNYKIEGKPQEIFDNLKPGEAPLFLDLETELTLPKNERNLGLWVSMRFFKLKNPMAFVSCCQHPHLMTDSNNIIKDQEEVIYIKFYFNQENFGETYTGNLVKELLERIPQEANTTNEFEISLCLLDEIDRRNKEELLNSFKHQNANFTFAYLKNSFKPVNKHEWLKKYGFKLDSNKLLEGIKDIVSCAIFFVAALNNTPEKFSRFFEEVKLPPTVPESEPPNKPTENEND